MEIYRCDRCKCIVEDYIPILFRGINQNKVKDGDNSEKSMFSLFNPVQYENKTWQLCTNCAEVIFHWLAHQENELKEVENG